MSSEYAIQGLLDASAAVSSVGCVPCHWTPHPGQPNPALTLQRFVGLDYCRNAVPVRILDTRGKILANHVCADAAWLLARLQPRWRKPAIATPTLRFQADSPFTLPTDCTPSLGIFSIVLISWILNWYSLSPSTWVESICFRSSAGLHPRGCPYLYS